MSPSSRQAKRWFCRAAVSGIIKLVLRNAATIQGTLFQKGYKAVLQTVKFSIVLVNSLCFDLNFCMDLHITHLFCRAAVSGIIQLALRNAATIQGTLFQ